MQVFEYARDDYDGWLPVRVLVPAGLLLVWVVLLFADMRRIAANFFGRTREYPAFGKYDPFQKLYHATLKLLAAAHASIELCRNWQHCLAATSHNACLPDCNHPIQTDFEWSKAPVSAVS